jgi:DNA-binding MarR family transcriptional regulator
MSKEEMLVEKICRVLNVAVQEMKTARDYNGIKLYYSEIHTLEAINNHENANISMLAEHMAVTVGAVWQVAKKLKAKGLIKQYHPQNNQKEVYFGLTKLGRLACEGHLKYHQSLNPEFSGFVEQLSEQEVKTIMKFLDGIIKSAVGIV